MLPRENTYSVSRFSTGLPSLLPGRIQRLYNNALDRIYCDVLQGHVNIFSGDLTCNNCFVVTRRNPEHHRIVNVHKITAGNVMPIFCTHCGGLVKYIRDVSECLACTRQLIDASEEELRVIEFLCNIPH